MEGKEHTNVSGGNNSIKSVNQFVNKMDQLEKRMDEIIKKQKQLQEAFYRMYEEQRRRERTL